MDTFKLLEDQDLGALASPFRRQILEELKSTPDSASNIARRHDMSRQRVGYHMRELVKAGYLEPAGERQQRGLKEQFYKARSYLYVHADIDVIGERSTQDRFSWANLLTSLARAVWDLIQIRRLADTQQKRVATLSIESDIRFATPADRTAFTEALIDHVEALVKQYHSPDIAAGRDFRFLVGAYPAINTGIKNKGRENRGREEDDNEIH